MSTQYIVRYGLRRSLGAFSVKAQHSLARNTEVILRSDRGMEWGQVLCPASEETGAYLGTTEVKGRLLREANDQDRILWDEVRAKRRRSFKAPGK